MAKKLPPITEVTACPHCGHDEFYVMQRYRGTGPYFRRFDNQGGADNTCMYDAVTETVGKTAFCGECDEPVARWDQDIHNPQYTNRKTL